MDVEKKARSMAKELVRIIEPVLRPEEVRDAFEEFLTVIRRWLLNGEADEKAAKP